MQWFFYIINFAPNALPAAAVRGLLVVSLLYHLHSQVWWMPTSENRPYCSADGLLGTVRLFCLKLFCRLILQCA